MALPVTYLLPVLLAWMQAPGAIVPGEAIEAGPVVPAEHHLNAFLNELDRRQASRLAQAEREHRHLEDELNRSSARRARAEETIPARWRKTSPEHRLTANGPGAVAVPFAGKLKLAGGDVERRAPAQRPTAGTPVNNHPPVAHMRLNYYSYRNGYTRRGPDHFALPSAAPSSVPGALTPPSFSPVILDQSPEHFDVSIPA